MTSVQVPITGRFAELRVTRPGACCGRRIDLVRPHLRYVRLGVEPVGNHFFESLAYNGKEQVRKALKTVDTAVLVMNDFDNAKERVAFKYPASWRVV